MHGNLKRGFLKLLLPFTAIILVLTLVLPRAGSAQGPSKDKADKEIQEIILPAMSILVEVPLPTEWQRKLRFLARKDFPSAEPYRKKLFGSTPVPLGTEPITSPAYGEGKRYAGPRFTIQGQGKPTAISFYFDEYRHGFEFVNNLAVVPAAYDEFTGEVDPVTGDKKAILKFRFTEEEGIKKAKEYIKEYTPGLGNLSGDFSLIETAHFDLEKTRPFVYRVTKAFRGVPLLDDYVQVAIDGEMKLMNLSYFWSFEIEPTTEDFTVIDPGYALQNAKRLILEDFNNNPPPLTLFNIRLAFINHRSNAFAIVPVWLFNLKWNEVVSLQNPSPGPTEAIFGKQIVQQELVYAVDALKGGRFETIYPKLKK